MVASQPMPGPPLDGVPPSPPGLGAGGGPNPQLSQLSPGMALSGSLQVTQAVLQAASQAAQLIDLIGQIKPEFAPVAAMLIEQMRGGLKSALQQGAAASEPGLPQMAMPTGQPMAGPTQQPLPPLSAGMAV